MIKQVSLLVFLVVPALSFGGHSAGVKMSTSPAEVCSLVAIGLFYGGIVVVENTPRAVWWAAEQTGRGLATLASEEMTHATLTAFGHGPVDDQDN